MEENLQPWIKAIVGLGNPGKRYENTRHNLGYEAVDLLKGKSKFVAGRGDFYFCRTRISYSEVVLLKPTTYMNLSGIAVLEMAQAEGLQSSQILVISDDFNLPLGQIRLRLSGSDGGHKGLASIVYHLNSDDLPRIRIGIGPVPVEMPPEEFVLEKFTRGEQDVVREMVSRTAKAVEMWLDEGFEKSAARFNRAIE